MASKQKRGAEEASGTLFGEVDLEEPVLDHQ
jgi:hypothetical protein